MAKEDVLKLLKFKDGIRTNKRDDYLNPLIDSAIDELKNIKGIALDLEKESHKTFVADWAYYKYVSRDNPVMPQYLKELRYQVFQRIIGKKPMLKPVEYLNSD